MDRHARQNDKTFLGLIERLVGVHLLQGPRLQHAKRVRFRARFFEADEVGVRVPTVLKALTGDAVVPAADASDAGVWGLLVGMGAATAGPTVVISTAGMVKGRGGRGGGGGSGRGRKLFFARVGGGRRGGSGRGGVTRGVKAPVRENVQRKG